MEKMEEFSIRLIVGESRPDNRLDERTELHGKRESWREKASECFDQIKCMKDIEKRARAAR